jgi:hypothetical protein
MGSILKLDRTRGYGFVALDDEGEGITEFLTGRLLDLGTVR